jgi:hypothetical protein
MVTTATAVSRSPSTAAISVAPPMRPRCPQPVPGGKPVPPGCKFLSGGCALRPGRPQRTVRRYAQYIDVAERSISQTCNGTAVMQKFPHFVPACSHHFKPLTRDGSQFTERSFIHASIAGSRSTAPLNRSSSVFIVAQLSAFEIHGDIALSLGRLCPDRGSTLWRTRSNVSPYRIC